MLRARILATIGGIIAMTAAFSPGMARADVPPGQIPLSLHTAIQHYIEGEGHDYAGLCVDVNANPPLPFGDYCSFVLSIEHDIAEVSYGPVASNDISLVSFRLEGGLWKVIGQAPSPTPVPSTATPTPTIPAQPTATPTTPAQPTTTPTVPPGLESAIKARIESIGKEYAGLCTVVNANPPVPFGKYCAFVNSITNGVADVSYGPVATNDITRVTFRLEGSQWKPVDPVTPTKTAVVPLPPATGSGSDDSGANAVVVAAIVSAVLLVSGAGAFAIRRR